MGMVLLSINNGYTGRRVKIVAFFVQSLSCVHSLQPHGLWHTRLPCPSPAPRACWNSCPLIRWCHPAISSPVVLFSSCLQSFPASGSFPVSQFFASGGRSIGVSASVSVLPVNIQGWFPLRLMIMFYNILSLFAHSAWFKQFSPPSFLGSRWTLSLSFILHLWGTCGCRELTGLISGAWQGVSRLTDDGQGHVLQRAELILWDKCDPYFGLFVLWGC